MSQSNHEKSNNREIVSAVNDFPTLNTCLKDLENSKSFRILLTQVNKIQEYLQTFTAKIKSFVGRCTLNYNVGFNFTILNSRINVIEIQIYFKGD